MTGFLVLLVALVLILAATRPGRGKAPARRMSPAEEAQYDLLDRDGDLVTAYEAKTVPVREPATSFETVSDLWS